MISNPIMVRQMDIFRHMCVLFSLTFPLFSLIYGYNLFSVVHYILILSYLQS